MEDTQLMKGILEGCVLAVIAKKETYGYEILTCMEQVGFDNLGEGTLYPGLTRLDKNGYISCRITRSGQERLEAFKESYKKISQSTNRILFEGNEKNGMEEGETMLC